MQPIQSLNQFQVVIGNKKLLSTLVIHLTEPAVTISYLNLNFGFCFKSDDSKQSKYVGRVENNTKIIFDLFNHSNILGEGVFNPIEVGFVNNKKIFITYYCNTIEEKTNKRRIEVSFYEAE